MALQRRSIARRAIHTAVIANTATRVSNRVQRRDEFDEREVATVAADPGPTTDDSVPDNDKLERGNE